MKKRSLLIFSLAFSLTATLAGGHMPGDVFASSSLFAQGKKTTLPEIRLMVTFRDDSADRLKSDSGGAYIDGAQKVTAFLTSIGEFSMDTNSSNHPALRSLHLDFSAPAEDNTSPISPAIYNPADGATIVTRGVSIPLQTMEVSTYQCVELGVGFRESSTQYTLAFHGKSYPTDDISGTSYALITRTSPDSWEIEPVAPCLEVPTVGKLNTNTTRGKTVWTSHGKYYVPFKMLLQPKP